MAGKKNETPTTSEQDTRRRLYTEATSALRDAHREEFQQILGGLHEKAGIEYRRRLTPEEKAREQMAALLKEFPGLSVPTSPLNDPSTLGERAEAPTE